MTHPTAGQHWREYLFQYYDIDASVEALDGEYDQNFAIIKAGKKIAVLKVMHAGCEQQLVDLQVSILTRIAASQECNEQHSEQHNEQHNKRGQIKLSNKLPEVVPIKASQGTPSRLYHTYPDELGADRLVWMIKWLPGQLLAEFRPHSPLLLERIGESLGDLVQALASFEHPALSRPIKWDLTKAGWIAEYFYLIKQPKRLAIATTVLSHWRDNLSPQLSRCRTTPIHNDINDYNLLVQQQGNGPVVSGIIDFGDSITNPVVSELAIAGAYVLLRQSHPLEALARLVKGFHARFPLTASEVDLIWPLLLTRLVVSGVNSAHMQLEKPDDPYMAISEKPVWAFLERFADLNTQWASFHLRVACGLEITDGASRCRAWLDAQRGQFKPVIQADFTDAPVLDISVNSSVMPVDPWQMDIGYFGTQLHSQTKGGIAVGRYAEPRLIYTSSDFRENQYLASRRRTLHLGVDLFSPAGTAVCAPCDAVVHAVDYRGDPLDYGGVVVLQHTLEFGGCFYTLYGHLQRQVIESLMPGDAIVAGQAFASLGDEQENGGWPPHLHFQLALHTLGKGCDIDGVADPDCRDLMQQLCPNPAALLNLADDAVEAPAESLDILQQQRQKLFPANLSLSYKNPVCVARAWRHYLFDNEGRPYLDAYNNVPHVGHSHPRVVAAIAQQAQRVNTNTRYLQQKQLDYAQALTDRFPDPLNVCLLLASGSEANEVALRLARAATDASDLLVMATGYHGHTNTALDISEYKFNGPGGKGAPDWVHVVPVADPYRGQYRQQSNAVSERDGTRDIGALYAEQVVKKIDQLSQSGKKLCGFICETYPSVGGQIIVPDGYFSTVYQAVRKAGGVCIADEVQTGLGRLGKDFWGFTAHQVVPDIVVLGKPMGNGYPMGAVITTEAIAKSFVTGMEFFSTFGGSTLACAAGLEVLNIIDDEQLAHNAQQVGDYALARLLALQEKHALIGEVRGVGLFLGVDLVTCRESREPATQAAGYIAERLREERILIGTDGPFNNVLKIRPPLTITTEDVDHLVSNLDQILHEVQFC